MRSQTAEKVDSVGFVAPRRTQCLDREVVEREPRVELACRRIGDSNGSEQNLEPDCLAVVETAARSQLAERGPTLWGRRS